MRTKVSNSSKNSSFPFTPTRRYRYDSRVERRRAHTDSRSRQWPVRPMRSVGPYRVASNKAQTTPGFPLGGKTAKTFTTQWAGTLNPYTMASLNVDKITKGDAINQRQRDIVHMKGWKTRFHVQSTFLVPVTLRVALISPRQTITPTLGTSLLRGYEETRQLDLGVDESGLAQCINPINDDIYMVLMHCKIEIGPTPASAGYTGGVQENWQTLEKWIPLDKQLRYPGSTASSSDTPSFLVFWYDSKIRRPGDAFSVLSTGGQVDIRSDTIGYFHDRD